MNTKNEEQEVLLRDRVKMPWDGREPAGKEYKGIPVFHCHYRVFDDLLKSDKNPKGMNSNGGCTVACILLDNELRWGVARCHPNDSFCKNDGTIKAYRAARSSKAAISMSVDIIGIKTLSDEFAKFAFNTTRESYPVFDEHLEHTFMVRNVEFITQTRQQRLL